MARRFTVDSPMAGTIVDRAAEPGAVVAAGRRLLSIESMKLEHPIPAPGAATVVRYLVEVGEVVERGAALVELEGVSGAPDDAAGAGDAAHARGTADAADTVESAGAAATSGSSPAGRRTEHDPGRADVAELEARRAHLSDEARPSAVAARHAQGRRTARENLADLLDPGSFEEYGGFAVAAQRRRRSLEELITETPADGLVCGTATIGAAELGPAASAVAVLAYDATVLAGTQGQANHRKTDRILELAAHRELPVILLAEGGGGRPGDTDAAGASWLDAAAFHLLARLGGRVPIVAFVDGRCFAGNAALAGCADVIVATSTSNLGMAGPAMIEGGGLGRVAADDIGPIEVQRSNGVVDVVVDDDRDGMAVVRRVLSLLRGDRSSQVAAGDQHVLRTLVPEDRRRGYEVGPLLDTLVDTGSLIELRADAAPGMVTALARIDGRPVGLLANDPRHLGGAIDVEAAESATRHLELCEAHGLPLVVLCDTPGFMVGPEAEREGGVRRFGQLFRAGAQLTTPIFGVVTRKAYGLGAMAMLGGHLQVPVATVAWPTGELGPMGLEGAVRLGYRRELGAIEDPDRRAEVEADMIARAHAEAAALHVATFAEIDDVIDPADTRRRIAATLGRLEP